MLVFADACSAGRYVRYGENKFQLRSHGKYFASISLGISQSNAIHFHGVQRLFQSIGAISVPPLAGYLKDLTGGYEICFFCMGTCMVLGSIPMLFLSFFDQDDDPTTTAEESDTSTVSN